MVDAARLRDVVYGAAVGDALGVPFEFRDRDTFTCEGMTDGGAHDVPKGTFSDDTSLLIATCDSIRASGGRLVVEDMRKRFRNWLFHGSYTADGYVFDVGNATAEALNQGYGADHEYSNGNGSLMRIAPLAFTKARDEAIRSVSAITHAHPISTTACVVFVHIMRDVLAGKELAASIESSVPDDDRFSFLFGLDALERDQVPSHGFVLDTLKASLWCALTTTSYVECVIAAVELGHDTDTTACVAGALAAAMYGFDAIPVEWVKSLRGKDVIDRCLF